MNYPVLAIALSGFMQLLSSVEYWTALPSGYIGIYRRNIDKLVLYSKDGQKWQLDDISRVDNVSFFARLFRPLSKIRAQVELRHEGSYDVDELRGAFRAAVEADDDILAQYYSHEQMYALNHTGFRGGHLV